MEHYLVFRVFKMCSVAVEAISCFSLCYEFVFVGACILKSYLLY